MCLPPVQDRRAILAARLCRFLLVQVLAIAAAQRVFSAQPQFHRETLASVAGALFPAGSRRIASVHRNAIVAVYRIVRGLKT